MTIHILYCTILNISVTWKIKNMLSYLDFKQERCGPYGFEFNKPWGVSHQMDPSGISKEDNMWYLKTKQYFTLQTWIFPTNGDVSQKEWEGLPPVNVGVSSKFLGHMDF